MRSVTVKKNRSCETAVTLLKNYIVKNSSSEKVAAIEGNVFWKSSCSRKTAHFFPKCSFSEKVDAVQK